MLFFGPDGSLMSVKWRNIKVWLRYSEGDDKPIVTPQWPMVFDLGSDPGERYNLFNTALTDYYWSWDNQGLKLAQLRFYAMPTTVP